MKNRQINILVGIFLLIGMLSFITLSIKISGLGFKDLQTNETYELIGYFDNIGNLKSGSSISLAGVEIGSVGLIELDQNNYNAKVHLEIDKNINNIPVDSIASIVTSGIIGNKYISIVVGAETIFFNDGDVFEETQSALIIEEIIGKYFVNSLNTKN
jgi:phospholipid/cholesterol/gamma-HCH transport system substrate-binding protein